MTALAPCPGCGRTDTVRRYPNVSHAVDHWVECDCEWQGPLGHAPDEAAAQWNRRAPTLRWRSAPPDVPGWWWYGYRDDSRPSIAYYSARECRRVQASLLSRAHWRWAGPIPEPEEGE